MAGENKSFRHDGNKIIHTRLLKAPRELVWEVWTNPEHIRLWWGPDSFTVTNKEMNVKPKGEWKFIMHGWGKNFDNHVRYREVVKPSLLVFRNGDDDDELGFNVTVNFEDRGDETLLTMTSEFKSAEIVDRLNREVNAIEGGKQTMNRLTDYVEKQFFLRQQSKINHMAGVSTYLNFPGKTEEAFLFYKSVFGGEFSGQGLMRFGDFPAQEGAPPISEADKKLIIHVALPITGGHVLMGTDAPESMGFKVEPGNNMHIQVETDSREEADRLFKGLSPGGKVSMDMQDMFWGAYFGSFADKYGINWMISHSKV